jgi:pre-mRNA-splicing helicase BRR2
MYVCSARPLDMDIHLQSFAIPHFLSLMIAMSKPAYLVIVAGLAYLAIVEYSPAEPVLIFVPSRRQCRLTVDDILTHCAADENMDQFLHIEMEDLQPHLDHVGNKDLVDCPKHGIGCYHEALDKQEQADC